MTVQKKQPTRKCVGCGAIRLKKELIRVIRDDEGNTMLDVTGRKNGRGAYICSNPECLKKAIKNKGLSRSLKVELDESVLIALRKELENIG